MRILKRILLVIGIALLFYPLVSSTIQKYQQQDVIATFKKQSEKMEQTNQKEELKKAQEYNDMLYQTQRVGIGTLQQEILSEDAYHNLLNFTGTGMMGSIVIPKIDVELPVYHGTEDQVLAKAVGHVEHSSIPIGGENTHSVLSGHRGLPTAKLFTRLDEMKQGDLFLLNIGGEKLAYQVVEIEVIEPKDVEGLMIESGKDLVSLVTCTPYGINTHRLVVTGERVAYNEETLRIVPAFSFSWRELVFAVLPFAVILIVTGQKVWEVQKKKKVKGVKSCEETK